MCSRLKALETLMTVGFYTDKKYKYIYDGLYRETLGPFPFCL